MNSCSINHEWVDELSDMIATGQIQNQCRLLGEGLSGRVYEYENYAVKVFKEDGSENRGDLILNRLHHHPAFPTLHHHEDRFMVMDKVDGSTLATELKNSAKLKESYFEQIEKYTEECFQEGIVPKDMHLNNLMVDRDNRIKIVDVGRFLHTDRPESFKDDLTEDLKNLHHSLFGFFSPFRKKRRYRSDSSGSYDRRRSYSSRSYSSSRRRHRKHRRRGYRSSS
ncbi:protein kinase-like protein [Melghirimyces profundicolus]|uniref:Protein kinase-like protein n=1 Tax=Melghirimyces profundicolus TaxID=1242148 RepID=A0A2T6BCA5_9BACL|nr:RIO1 family regulatory kinase/ATPase [Melghirimyces profundicolus]PTX53672.1 protein kinase-like protein [Melghirimyces profundicolus]